jgi:hypothetical protein
MSHSLLNMMLSSVTCVTLFIVHECYGVTLSVRQGGDNRCIMAERAMECAKADSRLSRLLCTYVLGQNQCSSP